MNRTLLTLAAALALLLGFGVATVFSAEDTTKPESKKAKYEDLPGKQHELLAKRAGTWTITGKFFRIGDEKAAPSTVTGSAEVQLVLGDRFVEEKLTLVGEDVAKKSCGYLGYDNQDKTYQAMYLSDKHTGMKVLNGSYDEKTNSLTFKGMRTDPETAKRWNIRVVLNMADNDRHILTFYCSETEGVRDDQSPPDTPLKTREFKEAELIYSRK